MTGRTTSGSAIGQRDFHALGKLALVWVLVTRCAGPVFKAIGHWPGRGAIAAQAVALSASHGPVRPRQRVPGLGVPSDGKSRGLEGIVSVADIAAILVRCARKLAPVNVLMAPGAGKILNSFPKEGASKNILGG